MSDAPIQLVDEHDQPLRGGTMDEAQLGGIWHRIARVMVYDVETDRYLLQKVKANPYYNGGLWNTTSSGHIDEGEDYIDAAARETREEMGLLGDLELEEIDRYRTESIKLNDGEERTYRRHNVTYLAKVKASMVIVAPNIDEVEDARWFSMDDLRTMRESPDSPLTDSLIRFIDTTKEDE